MWCMKKEVRKEDTSKKRENSAANFEGNSCLKIYC